LQIRFQDFGESTRESPPRRLCAARAPGAPAGIDIARLRANPSWRFAMPSVELTSDEAQILRQVLEGYLRDASGEISGTERFELREQLKHERDVIRRVVQGL
jgi:hypothetical protein